MTDAVGKDEVLSRAMAFPTAGEISSSDGADIFACPVVVSEIMEDIEDGLFSIKLATVSKRGSVAQSGRSTMAQNLGQ